MYFYKILIKVFNFFCCAQVPPISAKSFDKFPNYYLAEYGKFEKS